SPAEASVLLSGEKASARTQSVCPGRVAGSRPREASHSRTVRSCPAVASHLPFGEKQTALTGQRCPLSGKCFASSAVRCHRWALPSVQPVASELPSGAKATHQTPPPSFFPTAR